MRNLLAAGAASLFLAVGAASAYAASDAVVTRVNGPVYAGAAPAYDVYGNEILYPAPPGVIEGRSAFDESDPMYALAQPPYVYRPAYVERRAYTPFPFSVLPWNW